jgi:hypothetical protein
VLVYVPDHGGARGGGERTKREDGEKRERGEEIPDMWAPPPHGIHVSKSPSRTS